MPRSEVRETAAHLAEQFGDATFTTAQAESAGIARHRVKSAASAGTIQRLWKGHYHVTLASEVSIFPGLEAVEAQRIRAALARPELAGAVVGGPTAALLWELPTWRIRPSTKPLLLTPRASGARVSSRRGVRVAARDVEQARIVVGPGGLPVTDPLLTAIHLAASQGLTLAAQLVVLHGGMRRLWEWRMAANVAAGHEAELIAAHARLSSHDLANIASDATAREAMVREAEEVLLQADVPSRKRAIPAIEASDPRIETALESLSWARFIAAGIGLPTPQARVRGASGIQWRVDFLFGDRVIGECDGAVKYQSGYTAWDEKRRQSDLEAAGYIVVRWTWHEILRHPDRVIARIARALARAD